MWFAAASEILWLSRLARVDAHRADPWAKTSAEAYVEAENACAENALKRCHNDIYYYMYDLYSNNKRWNLRLNNDLVLLTVEG